MKLDRTNKIMLFFFPNASGSGTGAGSAEIAVNTEIMTEDAESDFPHPDMT